MAKSLAPETQKSWVFYEKIPVGTWTLRRTLTNCLVHGDFGKRGAWWNSFKMNEAAVLVEMNSRGRSGT